MIHEEERRQLSTRGGEGSSGRFHITVSGAGKREDGRSNVITET